MTFQLILILTFIVGSIPFILTLPKLTQFNWLCWIFSPVPSFYFAFVVAFIIRPALDIKHLVVFDSFYPLNHNFCAAQALGALSCYPFVLGYLLFRPTPPKFRDKKILPISPATPAGLNILWAQRASFLLAIVMMIGLSIILFRIDAFTLDMRHNRAVFTIAMVGGGHMVLLITFAATFLLIGMTYSLWSGRTGYLGWLAIIAVLVPNIFISTRMLVSSLIFIFAFLKVINQRRANQSMPMVFLVLALVVVLVLGIGLGLIRGHEGDVMDTWVPIAYLSETFDMGEMLQLVFDQHEKYEWGQSLLEDLLYTFVPRAIIPSKPVVYGSLRLQLEVVPSLMDDSDTFAATYPVGIYGEAFINFGIGGVLLALFLLGASLGYMYQMCLRLIDSTKVEWIPISCLVIHATLTVTSLGYMRSIGQFLAILLFQIVVLAVCFTIVSFLAELFSLPTGHRSSPFARSMAPAKVRTRPRTVLTQGNHD